MTGERDSTATDIFMPFGKRVAAPLNVSVAAASPHEPSPAEARLQGLRDHMLALLGTVQRIADAVREQGVVAMPPIANEPDVEAGPLVLKGFSEHFCTRTDEGFGHTIFGYSNPEDDHTVDPNAQYHLQQLTGQMLAFNLYCQRAAMDEALGVALQAPDVAGTVDSILVGIAFFAAYFENLIATTPRDGRLPELNLDLQRANLDRHLLMAQDKMIVPERLDELLPVKTWPLLGIEIEYAPHAGDYFINGVYFPAELATVLLAAHSHAKARAAKGI